MSFGYSHWSGSIAVAVALTAVLPSRAPVALGQQSTEQAIPDVENSRMSMVGIINSGQVYVRSGPGENYYPTMKLDKGAKVTVVGIKFDWLKILPPEGSFCYVSKAYVEKHGDGSVGRVTKDSVIVRAGSSLTSVKITPLTQLSSGSEVQIIGEQDEYFKIKPPEHAYFYVNKQFVTQDPDAKPTPQKTDHPIAPPSETAGAGEGDHGGDAAIPRVSAGATDVTPGSDTGMAAGTSGTTMPTTMEAVVTPSTNPSEDAAAMQDLFDKAEAEFKDASTKPLEQQALGDMIKEYQKIVASTTLPETPRRIAQARLGTLKVREAAAEEYAHVRKSEEELQRRQMALKAEREELEQRLAASGVAYTAVGTLRPSSLQVGSETLYRLTDPANGRTVCYVRTVDPKFTSLLDQFVGLKGQLTTDAQLGLRVLVPTDVAAVDPARVNNGVTAQLIPPSMMPKSEAASTGQP